MVHIVMDEFWAHQLLLIYDYTFDDVVSNIHLLKFLCSKKINNTLSLARFLSNGRQGLKNWKD